MYFMIIGRDGKDDQALTRRKIARPQHLALAEHNIEKGILLFGGAMLDDDGNMIGSMMVFKFNDRAACDEYLKSEPYVTGNVWHEIEVKPCQPAQAFAK